VDDRSSNKKPKWNFFDKFDTLFATLPHSLTNNCIQIITALSFLLILPDILKLIEYYEKD
jgi:hypothetical protein